MPLPADYYVNRTSEGWSVHHAYHGELFSGCECQAQAEEYAHEHAEQAAEQYEPSDSLQNAVADFLHMLDRDGLARHFEIGIGEDRVESAHLIGLRKAHAAATARAA